MLPQTFHLPSGIQETDYGHATNSGGSGGIPLNLKGSSDMNQRAQEETGEATGEEIGEECRRREVKKIRQKEKDISST